MSSTNFYEVLGIDADASPEDIRRAYRKKALRTHPDRLPPGATAEEREAANEHFRKANNAYEILMDTKNRRLYDLYGVWPPPEELPEEPKQRHGNSSGYPSNCPYPRSGPFFDPFFNSTPFAAPFTHNRSHPRFAFRDPFELFNALFTDMQRDFHHPTAPLNLNQPFDPFAHRQSSGFNSSHALSNFQGFSPFLLTPSFFPGSTFPDDDNDHWGSGPSRPNVTQSPSFRSSYGGQYAPGPNGQQPQWVSESTMMRSINGVTQTIHKKIDHQGNEHVTKIYPDGREKYTVNGVEQSQPSGHIQSVSNHGRLPPANPNYDSTPPIIPPDPEQGSSKKRWWERR